MVSYVACPGSTDWQPGEGVHRGKAYDTLWSCRSRRLRSMWDPRFAALDLWVHSALARDVADHFACLGFLG